MDPPGKQVYFILIDYRDETNHKKNLKSQETNKDRVLFYFWKVDW